MTVAVRRPRTVEEAPPRARLAWEVAYGRRVAYSDALVVVSSVFGAQLLWIHLHALLVNEPAIASAAQPFASFYSIGLVLAWMGFLAFFGSRDRRVAGVGSREYRKVIAASLAAFGALAVVVYLFNLQLARGYFFIALPIGLAFLLVERRLWRVWLCAQRAAGEYSSTVVLVGSAASVTHIARQLGRMPRAGFRVVGACVPPRDLGSPAMGAEIPVVGDLDHLMASIDSVGADTVVITSSDELSPQRVRELSWQLEPGHQHLIVAPALTDIGGPRIHTRPVAGLPLIHVETPRFRGGRSQAKRLFDIVASAGILLLLLPVLAAIALAIRAGSPGPVLFRQRRIGRNGRPFLMLKFRSMVPDAENQLARLRADAGNAVLFKMRDDPRVTPLGRVLRRYSLDELPQLFNVLTGEMSLIGPRPPLPVEVERYERHVHRRFLVKPGITGLWQVSGRSDLSWEESVRLDLSYVENWTLTGDIAILARTAHAVLARDGAY
jgi:exopolysaccharide biosynthesis polyprenyl glycosylphosphotransferase